jgi:hypothetical protein
MTVDDLVNAANWVSRLSPLGFALLIVLVVGYAFYKQWLVFGPFYADQENRLAKTEQQRDDALELAAKLTGILEAGRRGSYRGR